MLGMCFYQMRHSSVLCDLRNVSDIFNASFRSKIFEPRLLIRFDLIQLDGFSSPIQIEPHCGSSQATYKQTSHSVDGFTIRLID